MEEKWKKANKFKVIEDTKRNLSAVLQNKKRKFESEKRPYLSNKIFPALFIPISR